MPTFVHGLRLSALFYDEAVKPILVTLLPPSAYAATLLGPGSEVLGYDTPLSTDHDWGPRLLLFLATHHDRTEIPRIADALQRHWTLQDQGQPFRFSHHTPYLSNPSARNSVPVSSSEASAVGRIRSEGERSLASRAAPCV